MPLYNFGGSVFTGGAVTSPITGTGATVAASAPVLDMSQTWNNVAVTFTSWKLNVTDTTSAGASLLVDLQVASGSKFSVTKAGAVTAASTITSAGLVSTGNITAGAAAAISFSGRVILGSPADGVVQIEKNAGSGAQNTVSQLPAAGSTNKGARSFVTDSTAAMTAGIGAIVAGAGANNVPVYSDGTNWRIG